MRITITLVCLAALSPAVLGQDTWAFDPPKDEFKADSLLDLRGLNEKQAGQNGFVKVSAAGEFLLADGTPARFWAVNTGAYEKHPLKPAPDLARHARFLAKRGVNMVRFHGNITPTDGKLADIDQAERDKLWRLVAAVKAEGIYVTFSPYWAVSSRVKPEMGVLSAGKAGNMGLLFFDPKLQEAYKGWLKQVLTEKNPYTGVALAKDPALAIIQLQNEDSLLFWTSQGIEGPAAAELRRQFGTFAAAKYGSLDKALEAWKGDKDKADNFAAGEAGVAIVWELTQARQGGRAVRLADQTQFMTETMMKFNAAMAKYLREELGCGQLVNAGNWRTADETKLLDCERYSYTASEVIGVNRYYTGAHKGKNAGWAIVTGDQYTDVSVLLEPRQFPLALRQVEGRPIIIPEVSWVPPLSRQSEAAFLAAAYESLTGAGPMYWFATGEEAWRQPGSANGYMPSEGKWVCATPMLMGQWPAAAWTYRKGLVKKAPPAVTECRTLSDMWARVNPAISEDPGFDPNRDKGIGPATAGQQQTIDPLAYLVGPVVAKYGCAKGEVKTLDLAMYIDRQKKVVRSATGELEWDYGIGVCTMNSPAAQGAAGALKARSPITLGDVEIRCNNAYATVLVASMDGKALAQSGKVLVQVGTVAYPTGWQSKPVEIVDGKNKLAGFEVVSFGKAPWQVENADITIVLRNQAVRNAKVLDANGMAVKTTPLTADGGKVTLKLPPDALYVILE